MEQRWPLVGLLLLPWLLVLHGVAANISRHDFPRGFFFGAGTSAYQVEGAAAEDGRKPSIWDAFTHAGRISDKSTGDIAADQYHKYKEDVKLMHQMGVNAYRFSFSWSRLIPDGRGSVNPKGLQYYNNLIDELLSHGIEPHVTLHHFDRPQSLEDEYGGLLNRAIVEDFTAYADVCFKEFGDRVKYWTSFNEANIEPIVGYDLGVFPPGRCSYPFGNCTEGNSTTEPYITAHNILLAHASVASLYKDKYQAEQGGYIGINILGLWIEPFTNSSENVAAAQRMLDFMIGWTMDPLVHGTYPAIMRQIVGSRLPCFSTQESKKLIASTDFIGINHYAVAYVLAAPFDLDKKVRDYYTDISIKFPTLSRELGTVLLFQESPSIHATPWGLQKMLEYMKVKYANPPVLIHENGYAEYNVDITRNERDYDDEFRANFLREYIEGMLPSIRNGSNACGYFVWSFIDSFELFYGYTSRYGLYGVDFKRKNRTRYPRYSAHWYSRFLKSSGLESRTSGDTYFE